MTSEAQSSNTSGGDLLAAGMAGMFNIGSDISSRVYARKANRQQRDHQVFMWHAQNAYNAPAAQMERLRAAGLNPNLVYGNGGAANTASNAGQPSQTPLPNVDLGAAFGEGLAAYQAIRMNRSQLASMDKARQVQDADIALKNVKALEAAQNTAKSAAQTDAISSMLQHQIDAIMANTRNMELKNIEQEFNNEKMPERYRMEFLQSMYNLKLAQSTLSTEQIKRAIDHENYRLLKAGIPPNTPAWQRFLYSMVTPTSAGTAVKKGIKSYFNVWNTGYKALYNFLSK